VIPALVAAIRAASGQVAATKEAAG